MTRERAKELLPVIQAFAEGRAVQFRSNLNGSWIDGDIINFDLAQDFRIKPEPREFWIAEFQPDHVKRDAYRTPGLAEGDKRCGATIIHVREVL